MPTNAVLCDDIGGMDLAVGHLRGLEHEDSVSSPRRPTHASHASRVRGIEGARRRLPFHPNPADSGVEELKRVYRKRTLSAFIALEDMLTPLYMACHALGIEIPEDMSVIGINDGIDVKALEPKTTMIRIPMLEMAIRAVDMLDESIRSGKNVASALYRETLVERASCAAARRGP
jgi:DNA-binding LacI/PurR family transcriptional regulator